MSWSRLKKTNTSKYAIIVIAIVIVAIAILIIPTLLRQEVTITGTVTIMRSHDPLNQIPVPEYIKFIDINSSAVYEYSFSSFRIEYLGDQADYSLKVPNNQTYRVEISWSAANSSGMWTEGPYSFDQPAGQPTIVKNFVG